MSRHTFTSESATEGHPDKMADQISDSVLDAVLTEDPYGRVACETLVTTGLCVVAGEISTKAHVDFSRLARDTICEIGYTDASYGIDGKTCGVIVSIDEQSPDIAMGVDKAREIKDGIGDVYDEIGVGYGNSRRPDPSQPDLPIASTSGTRTNVHRPSSTLRISKHVAAVRAPAHGVPSSRACLTSRRRRPIRSWNALHSRVPSRTRCPWRNPRCANDSNRRPIRSPSPPRSIIA